MPSTTVALIDRLISQHNARVHAAKLAAEETGRALAEAQGTVRALQLELGRRQDAHAEAGKDLAALCRCRGIVGREG